MLPAYGFHIDFEFWVETTWLSGSQMAQTPKELKSGSALSWVDQSEIFHFHTGFYVYDQLWKVVDLEYQQFRAKKTTLFFSPTPQAISWLNLGFVTLNILVNNDVAEHTYSLK